MNHIARILVIFVFTIMLLFLVLLLASREFAISTTGGPDLVCNGDFEKGNFNGSENEPRTNIRGADGKELCGGSSSLEDWQVIRLGTNNQDCVHSKDAIYWSNSSNDPNLFLANTGERYLDITGFADRPPKQFGRLQQNVRDLQTGATYQLSCAIGSSSLFPPPTPTPPNQPEIGVFVEIAGVRNGKVSQPFVAPPSSVVSQWVMPDHGIRFEAVGSTATITISAIGQPSAQTGNGGIYLGLDTVSIHQVCLIFDAIVFGCRQPKPECSS
jgi:hypothetical protein